MVYWLIDWLIDWLIEWLIDWLIDHDDVLFLVLQADLRPGRDPGRGSDGGVRTRPSVRASAGPYRRRRWPRWFSVPFPATLTMFSMKVSSSSCWFVMTRKVFAVSFVAGVIQFLVVTLVFGYSSLIVPQKIQCNWLCLVDVKKLAKPTELYYDGLGAWDQNCGKITNQFQYVDGEAKVSGKKISRCISDSHDRIFCGKTPKESINQSNNQPNEPVRSDSSIAYIQNYSQA